MGFESSEPQMVIGSLMETALPAFEQVLFDKTRPPVASIINHNNSTAINIVPDGTSNQPVDNTAASAH